MLEISVLEMGQVLVLELMSPAFKRRFIVLKSVYNIYPAPEKN